MISKMDKQRKQKNDSNGEERKNYGKLRKELKRAKDKAKKEYLQSILDDILLLKRTGC